jgi:hypothetical protein
MKDDDGGHHCHGGRPGIGHCWHAYLGENRMDPIHQEFSDRGAQKFCPLALLEFHQEVIKVSLAWLLVALEADDPVHRFVTHGARLVS